MSSDRLPVRRALLSVSDKTGLIDFAQALAGHGVEELRYAGGTWDTGTDSGLSLAAIRDAMPELARMARNRRRRKAQTSLPLGRLAERRTASWVAKRWCSFARN